MASLLIVDDDLGARETFRILVEHYGFTAHTAVSGRDALEQFRRYSIDLILADLRLPDFSGIHLLEQLRAEGFPTPVILVTGFGTVRSAVQAMRLGAVGYLEKPVLDDELIAAVHQALRAVHVSEVAPAVESQSANRLAALIGAVIASPTDPVTLRRWAELARCSIATLENRARATGTTAKTALDFARMLRAVILAREGRPVLEAILDCDPRTLQRLLNGARITGDDAPRVNVFLERQQFVRNSYLIRAIRVLGAPASAVPCA